MGVHVKSREERQAERAQRAVRKAEKRRERLESFANRISPQFMQMTPEERRKFTQENPHLFRGGGGG